MRRDRRAEPYPVVESLRRYRKAITESLPSANAQPILAFLDKCAADGLTAHRQVFYASHLKPIAQLLGAAFPNPSRKDIEKLLAEIESRDYEVWTKIGYKTTTKRFYKWLLGKDEEFPESVRWVKTRNGARVNRVSAADLPTPAEVQAMAKVAMNERDRAILTLLADSGGRVGEILKLRIGDVTFDQYGLVLSVNGKTGDRGVRVVGDSIAYVAAWLEVHPRGQDRKAPLFVGLDARTRERPMTYAQLRKVILTLAQRAEIEKRIHPHLFRHAKATELAARVPEGPLEAQMGWVPGSAMSKTYVHLSRRDVDAAILRASGIDVEEEKKTAEHVRICPRCQVPNASMMKFCRRCGLPLDLELAIKLEDDRQREVDLDPKFEAMRREVQRLGRELERLAKGQAVQGRPSARGAVAA